MEVRVNTRVLAFEPAGVQRYIRELMPRLPGVVPICPSITLGGIAGHAWEQCCLPRRLKSAPLWSPSNTGPLSCPRQIVTIHDIVPLDHPEWLDPKFAAWYRFLLPRLAARVHAILTDSEFSRTRLCETLGLGGEKVKAVYLGVDERFRPCEAQEIAAAHEALNLPSRHYVLSLGSLEPRKNLARLLAAWRLASPRLPEEIWLLLGGAKGAGRVFADPRLPPPPPRARFLGSVPDAVLPALYSGALAFVYPSLYEGFGFPPLEAMACGTPVITSNTTSLAEIAADAALTVDPTDVAAIADAIVSLCDNSQWRAEFARKGRARAAEFTWDKTARATRQCLEALG